MIKGIKNLFSLIIFQHAVFSLPFAIIGFMLSLNKNPVVDNGLFFKMCLALLLVRGAGISFNRIIDFKYDKLNNRTKDRVLSAGKMKISQAWIFCLLQSLLFILLCYYINFICFLLSFISLFFIFFYSYTKRFTFLCHWILGICLCFSPLGGYFSNVPVLHFLPFIYALIVLFWSAGFDILYALQDEQYDKKNKLFSIPSKFGYKKSIMISRMNHFLVFLLLLYTFYLYSFSFFYAFGVLIFLFFLIYQHWLLKKYQLKKINKAFFLSNGIASVFFLLFFLLDYYYPLNGSQLLSFISIT